MLENDETDRLRTWKNPTLAQILQQADGAAAVEDGAPESPGAIEAGCSGQAALGSSVLAHSGSSGLKHTLSGCVQTG